MIVVMRTTALGMLMLFAGCMKNLQKDVIGGSVESRFGTYAVTERYEVTGGPREGMTGESAYAVTLRAMPGDSLVTIENLANSYTVQARWKGDSLYIDSRQFPYYDSFVSISGAGRVSRGGVSFVYFSGGPAGQITSVCSGVKIGTMPAGKIVVAHRGAWKKQAHPENSVAALKEAIALRCAGSEFDVRMTADDSLVVNHDPSYHSLPIETTPYARLTAFTLANGEKLPTLREYLRAGMEGAHSTTLVCEIKPSEAGTERGQAIAERVVRLVEEFRAQEIVVYISFDHAMLKKIIAMDPSCRTQYLQGDRTPEQLKTDGITGADYHLSVFKAHPEWIESAKNLGIVLNAWTVNTAPDMDWLLVRGFGYITTNEPELLQERIAQLAGGADKKQ